MPPRVEREIFETPALAATGDLQKSSGAQNKETS